MNPLSRRHLLKTSLLAGPLSWVKADNPFFSSEISDPPPRPELLDKAETGYSQKLGEARLYYRQQLGEAIQQADRMVAFLLDFDLPQNSDSIPDEKQFPILPYEKYTQILDSKELDKTATTEAKSHFRRLLNSNDGDGGAFCHYPIHGVRFFKDKEIIFQTSLCWHCANYYVQYPSHYEWHTLRDTKLEDYMKKIMPIPPTEIERFNKK